MASVSKIEWTDSTFSPWIGCTKISPACDHCYAEAQMDTRMGRVQWGAGQARSRTSAAYWKQPLRWNVERFVACDDCGHRGLTAGRRGRFCEECSSANVHNARRRVFCASLADVFDNEVDPAWRADLLDLIAATPNLDWLLLTKRIGNAGEMMRIASTGARMMGAEWPLPNIWLGATICNQAEAHRDIPKLLATPAAKRFLSIEPMLGPIDLTVDGLVCLPCRNAEHMMMDPTTGAYECCRACDYTGVGDEWGIDWIICGAESGPHARPMHPDWARSLRDQCAAAGVPFLFKQWGEWIPAGQRAADAPKVMTREMQMAHEAAGRFSFARLSSDAHISTDVPVWRIGKHAAGRLLDGVEHNGVPAP